MTYIKSAFLAVSVITAVVLPASLVKAGSHVGVTAAVNKQAKSTLPSGRVRTVVMGNKVIFKERINTSGSGLVQVLFVDGSTLTVGANASLVIDQFVYNPAKGTGKLAVSFGKGVMRFIGGKISKTKGGVTVRTTVGTAGIRGGMANIGVNNGKGVFSFLYGDELTFLGLGGQRRRVYQSGYTLLAEREGATQYSRLVIRRTRKGDTEFFQTRLAGDRRQKGGARRKPTDGQVANGPLPHRNSLVPLPRISPFAPPQTVVSTPLPEIEDDLLDLSNSTDPLLNSEIDTCNYETYTGC
ncbi:MAG TPA: hypothetical protein ENJ55_04145 [Rhizobiales bacterium]|nr:hypothetical protein [Hyphomicrobiales bacterium]